MSVAVLLYNVQIKTYQRIEQMLTTIAANNFDVHHENDYTNAIRIIEQRHCEVCMVEQSAIETDGHDGLDFIQEVHRLQPYLPIILLTEDNASIDMAAMKSGAVDYLVKPYLNEKNLERALRYAFERTHLYETLESQYEDIQEVNALKSQMIRVAAHDLRNPLSNILLSLDMILRLQERIPDDPEDIKKHLLRIRQASRSMQRIIAEILTLDYIDAQPSEIAERIDLRRLVKDTLSTDELKQIDPDQVAMTLPECPVFVHGDTRQLQQAITYLIVTAWERNLNKGQIHISLEPEQRAGTSRINMTVSDDGEHIDETISDMLRAPYRFNHSDRQSFGEQELRLYLCKRIVQRYRGELYLQNLTQSGNAVGFSLPVITNGESSYSA